MTNAFRGRPIAHRVGQIRQQLHRIIGKAHCHRVAHLVDPQSGNDQIENPCRRLATRHERIGRVQLVVARINPIVENRRVRCDDHGRRRSRPSFIHRTIRSVPMAGSRSRSSSIRAEASRLRTAPNRSGTAASTARLWPTRGNLWITPQESSSIMPSTRRAMSFLSQCVLASARVTHGKAYVSSCESTPAECSATAPAPP